MSMVILHQFWHVPYIKDPVAIKVLGDYVRRYRQEKNLSLEMLANIADMEYSQVSRIERGIVNTSVSVIFAIAKALEVKPSQLLAAD